MKVGAKKGMGYRVDRGSRKERGSVFGSLVHYTDVIIISISPAHDALQVNDHYQRHPIYI